MFEHFADFFCRKNIKATNSVTFGLRYASINSSGAHSPAWATAGHLLMLSVLGVGHSQFYCSPGGWVLAYPEAIHGHLTQVFSKDGRVYWEGRGLCQRLTSPSGTRKNLSMFLKVRFLNFRYFFIT